MSAYLLDTNVWIEYLRRRNSRIVRKIQNLRPRDIAMSSVTVGELSYGAYRSADPTANLALLDELLASFVSLPFDDVAAETFGEQRAILAAAGKLIGPLDLQIAAIALVGGLILVTHNTAEFSRISGLKLEDWHS